MKKKAFLFLFILTILLIGCNNRNAFGCYTTLESASKNANRKDQEILVLVSNDDNISISNFLQYFYPNFTIVQISEANKGNILLSKLNISSLPKLSLYTKEGYFAFDFTVEDKLINEELMNQYIKKQDALNQLKALIKRTEKGSNLQRIQAIEELYSKMEPEYRFSLKKLIEKVPSLDRKNESALVKKYVIENANLTAQNYLLSKESKKAANVYENIAKSKYLSDSEKQQYYYSAALILIYTKNSETQLIKKYLQKAIKADKQSNESIKIQNMLDLVNQGQ